MDEERFTRLLRLVTTPIASPTATVEVTSTYDFAFDWFNCPQCDAVVSATSSRHVRRHSPGSGKRESGKPVCSASGVAIRYADQPVRRSDDERHRDKQDAYSGPIYQMSGWFGWDVKDYFASDNYASWKFLLDGGMSLDLTPFREAYQNWHSLTHYVGIGLDHVRVQPCARNGVRVGFIAERSGRSHVRTLSLTAKDGWALTFRLPMPPADRANDHHPARQYSDGDQVSDPLAATVAGFPFATDLLTASKAAPALLSTIRETLDAGATLRADAPDEALRCMGWFMLGVTDPRLIDRLTTTGFDTRRPATLNRLRTWLDAGWTLSEVLDWAGAAPMPWHAGTCRTAGMEAEDVAHWVAGWSELRNLGLARTDDHNGIEFQPFYDDLATWHRHGWTVDALGQVIAHKPTTRAPLDPSAWVEVWTQMLGPEMASRYAAAGMTLTEAVAAHHSTTPPTREQLDLLISLR